MAISGLKYTLRDNYMRRKNDRDIFQELMAFKVREILLVANPYDAYTITADGQFFDRIVGEYLQLNLYTAPRITSVSTADEALQFMERGSYDMVILMAGLDKQAPLYLAERINALNAGIPILMLVNNNSDLKYFKMVGGQCAFIDRVFVWNGDSKVFLAMIKYTEDRKNVEADTAIGDVRIILLVEDSVRYYTRYLPLLYATVMRQTQAIIEEHTVDELHKILKMRARPKILLCTSYEEARATVDRFTNNLLCVITDVSFEKDGKSTPDAGIQLVEYIRSKISIPMLMQSSNAANQAKADKLGTDFLHKTSDNLAHNIQEFLMSRCGFGDFLFKTAAGHIIDRARTISEFEDKLRLVSEESLQYHGGRQGISTWLMARGEISLAQMLRPVSIEDFKTGQHLREAILERFEYARLERLKGRVVQFDPKHLDSNRFIVRLGNGSLGGKGRGLAFISHLIENIELTKLIKGVNILLPPTAIIGVEEFGIFMDKNRLYERVLAEPVPFGELCDLFAEHELSAGLRDKLFHYVQKITVPLAIRSSGLFEDSLHQPFSGVYTTFVLPNNHPDIGERFRQLTRAVKMVYASVFSPDARNYFNAVNYKIEEEKMAVIIQALVGKNYGDYFFPSVSGVAQSYNFYPFAYMEPEDGFSVAAVGLGMYVVGGEKSYRFCPRYPHLELQALPDQVKDTQTAFYALNLKKNNWLPDATMPDDNIDKLYLKTAETLGALTNAAQVYDGANDRLVNSFDVRGPRVVNFANILKYDAWPMAETISLLLDMFSEAMGVPVEIEYAAEYSNGVPAFNILQIKPLIRSDFNIVVNVDQMADEYTLMYAEKGMGNGIINDIRYLVYVDTNAFDKTLTTDIAREIGEINQWFDTQQLEYILVGPGRWGTRDKFTGIPVQWSQISRARVIIELGLEEFPLEASLGSHFFHNVTSMNVGYFSITHKDPRNRFNQKLLDSLEIVKQFRYARVYAFDTPARIEMDGKRRKAIIALK